MSERFGISGLKFIWDLADWGLGSRTIIMKTGQKPALDEQPVLKKE